MLLKLMTNFDRGNTKATLLDLLQNNDLANIMNTNFIKKVTGSRHCKWQNCVSPLEKRIVISLKNTKTFILVKQWLIFLPVYIAIR